MRLPATLSCLALLGLSCLPAHALDEARAKGILTDLSAEASRPAPNDLFRADMYFEAGDASAAILARRVSSTMQSALASTRQHPGVKVQTGNSSTYPVYSKNGRQIESWRSRAELHLESRDSAAISELVGTLQNQLALGQFSAQPSDETLRKVENEAMVEALGLLQQRARLLADTLGKPYRLIRLTVNQAGGTFPPPRPLMRAKAMMADAAMETMPVEAGETRVTVSISGQVDIAEP